MKKITALILGFVLAVLPLAGCGQITTVQAADLLQGVEPANVEPEPMSDADLAAAADFSVRLFQQGMEGDAGENVLMSPLSVLYALGMTMGGAQGQTLSQMAEVLGMDADGLSKRLCAYARSLPADEKAKLTLANSVWMRDDEDRLHVEPDFLQKTADNYGAGLYKAAFDKQTLEDINNWVNTNTDGMMPKIIDEIPSEAVMYLVNALAFDAEWEVIYRKDQVRDGVFKAQDGTEEQAEFMHSEENLYLQDQNASGFIKPYAGGRYAFAALLPDEGTSLEDYAASLTGEKLLSLLDGAQSTEVNAALPKFQNKYSAELSVMLQAMGMSDALSGEKADFKGMATSSRGNIFISRVLHETVITVDEKGTRAGAATAVEATDESAPLDPPKTVCLDRPFLYLLVDLEASMPLFIGTVNQLEN